MMGDKLEGLGLPNLKMNLVKTKISHTQGVCVRENDQEQGETLLLQLLTRTQELNLILGRNRMHELIFLII
ncbi:hypothetical protein HanIR_Chr14g0714921 [Helianthus annuus]|nr:hypothetical protein HanIR_Chr14g0714921 [Helianthus annuus]